MKQQGLWIIVVVAIIVAAGLTTHRIRIEQENTRVELVMDYSGLKELSYQSDLPMTYILSQLQPVGVTQIALSEWTFADQLVANNSFLDLSATKLWNEVHVRGQHLTEPVGFAIDEIAIIESMGFSIVPRVNNRKAIHQDLQVVLGDLHPNLLIFAGNQMIGYPENIQTTDTVVQGLSARIGLVEFSSQLGLAQIASVENSVRVHAISAGEMELLPTNRIVSRYLRAVRERNIRVLYLRPFVTGPQPLARTLEMLSSLETELVTSGFTLGQAMPYPRWTASKGVLAILYLGVWAGVWLLLLYFMECPKRIVYGTLLVVWVVTIAIAQMYPARIQQGMALLGACLLPGLAVLVGKDIHGRSLSQYSFVSGVTLAISLLMVGLLSQTEYMIKLLEFRGVKLMHIVPVMILFLYGLLAPTLPFTRTKQLTSQIGKWWGYRLPIKYLLAGTVLAGVGYIYLQRTGSFGFPVSQGEIALREGLERLLIVRPRTKEFLLGYPILYFLLRAKIQHPLLLAIAVIGPLSTVNTFTHIHTPVIYSLLRSVYSMVFGYLLGWLLYKVYSWWRGWRNDDSNIWVLRIRQLGR